MEEDIRQKLIKLGEMEMSNTYADAPEDAPVNSRRSVIEMILDEMDERISRIDIQTKDLWKIFAPVLQDKSNIAPRSDDQEAMAIYSPLGKRLQAMEINLQDIEERLMSLVNDSEV